MKKFLLVFLVSFCLSSVCFAADVKVQINGEIIDFKDSAGNTVNAQIINDRTMVPMRKIFELLGAIVDWDGENQIVTGTKGNTIITLQINNNVVTKEVSGEKETITLDVPPMIVNDRTLVPLRFIAESLDKQVGWDSDNRTAIIIDYGYFSNELKNNHQYLYDFFTKKKEYAIMSYTQNYYDLLAPTENTTMNIKLNATVKNNPMDVAFTITGNSELAKDITTEHWNSTAFSLDFSGESVLLKSDNTVLKEMLRVGGAGREYFYEEYGLEGTENDNMDEFFRTWAGVSDNDVRINTFAALKADFGRLMQLLKSTSIIRYSNYNLEYFDLAKLDNMISNNNFFKVFNFVTKFFIKYDVEKEVMLYDFSKITLSVSGNADAIKITVTLENDYDEKYECILELKHA